MITDRPRAEPDLTTRPLEWNPPRTAISRVPYLPGLDGMRALAVVAVMVYHANSDWLAGGFIGVEVFFVISGYLITLLMIGEHEKTGRLDLKQFWLRRARRLLPALFVMLALLVTYCALFKRGELGNIRGDVVAGVGYVTNWYQIWVGQGYTAVNDFAPLRHLWSLAVEEQFYLLWPLVMVGLIRLGRRRLPNISRWLLLTAVLVAVMTALLFHSGDPASTSAFWDVGGRQINRNDALYLSTITRSSGLLIGAAFAMLWRPVAVMRGPLRERGRQLDLLALAGLAGLGLLAWKLHVTHEDGSGDAWLYRGGFLAVAICTVLMMAAVTHRGAAAGRLLGNPLLNWIGTRSYGLYLFHWPIYQIIREIAGKKLTPGEFALAMAITLPITEASYRLIEMPVRRRQLGDWWRRITEQPDPRPRQATVIGGALVVALLGFSAVSMAGAERRGNDVDRILDEGRDATSSFDEVIAAAGSTTTAPPAPTVATTTVPAAVTPTAAAAEEPVETTTTAAPTTTMAPLDVAGGMLAIGDSVMLGAADELKARGYTVIALESRQFSDVVADIERLVASGGLPEVVVLHLGTNGTIDQSDAAAMFSALEDVPVVLALTIYGPSRSWVGPNNELIRSLLGQYSNVVPGNWDVFAGDCDDWAADQGLSGSCYASDGYHLNSAGAAYYAQAIDYWVDARKSALGIS